MADAGAERNDTMGRRGQARGRISSSAPRFVNRIPGRLPAPLAHVHHATRSSPRWPSASVGGRVQRHGVRGEPSLIRVRSVSAKTDVGAGSPDVSSGGLLPPRSKGEPMKRPTVKSLDTVSLEEALAYLDAANGDELGAAFTLAADRNRLDGGSKAPDETEVHHALFLLRKARGLEAPSFDLMRVQLRRRVAA
jgi:hypothetical protein